MIDTDWLGNKKDNITIIYTPWSNLKKDGSMAVGQVSFKDNKKVKRVLVAQRENPIVNRLNKTKVEKHPDLRQEREDHQKELRKRDQSAQLARVGGYDLIQGIICTRMTNMARKKKRPVLPRSARSSSTAKNMRTTTCLRRITWSIPATRTAVRTGRTILCRQTLTAMMVQVIWYK